MDASDLITGENHPEPTVRQKERAARLRRFNWLFVYLPTSLITVLVIGILVYLLVISLPDNPEARKNVSAIADGLMILATLPLLVICGVLPALAFFVTIQARQRGIAPVLKIQRLSWRMEKGLVNISARVKNVSTRSVRPVINIHARWNYFVTLLKRFNKVLKRS